MQDLNNFADTQLDRTVPINQSDNAIREDGGNGHKAGGISHNSHTPLMKPPMANQGDDDDLSFQQSPVATRMHQVQQHNEPQRLMLDLTKFDE